MLWERELGVNDMQLHFILRRLILQKGERPKMIWLSGDKFWALDLIYPRHYVLVWLLRIVSYGMSFDYPRMPGRQSD